MTQRELELINRAEKAMRDLSFILEGKKGHKQLRDRVNTVCSKICELKRIEEVEKGMFDE